MKRGLDRLAVLGQRVFVRVDFNVPLKDGKVRDDTRIRAALPTIDALRRGGARVVLATHLGHPKGGPDPQLSLAPVAARLSELLGAPVALAPDSVGPAAEAVVEGLANGAVALLENTRFYPQEEQNDPAHASRLAKLADLYVNDAFGAAHRAHASTEGIARLLPSAAGLHMAAELSALERALADPVRPFAAIIGGAKASDKIEVLKRLASLADVLLIGGGMGNTFLHARGVNLQASLLEPDLVETARDVDEIAARAHCRVVLPVDGVVAAEASAGAERRTVPVSEIPPGWRILDVGPRTTAAYGEALQGVKTVLWNGPMGVYELAPFAEGTNRLARLLAESGAFVVVGGGDAVAAVQAAGVADKMGHLSTGGGATLEFVEGKILPGVAVLPDA